MPRESLHYRFVANVADVMFFRDPVEIGDPVLAQWAPEHVYVLPGRSDSRAEVAAPYAGEAG